jgi:O-acetyl-ADP-ribose deacetylase (regulator of RNase III)
LKLFRSGIFERKEAPVIEFKTGDILKEDVEALVNTVNCVGIMGRGVALRFKEAFPENFKVYALACQRGEVQPGRMLVFETGYVTNPRYIINFPTKRHWRGKARVEDIEKGLEALVAEVSHRRIRSLAVPPLGSGLGGLDWVVVRPIIERALLPLPHIRVLVFEPQPLSVAETKAKRGKVPEMTPGRAALIGLMDRYRGGLLDPFITLLEVHKLMYFMQEAGEQLRLRFVPAPYGPFAENLRHVLRAIEGYYVSGYGEAGDEPGKSLELVPGAISDARAVLEGRRPTRVRFERVAQLVEGFESPFGLELLSTVHWIVTRDRPASADDLIARFYAWADRKRRFTPQQIRLAKKVLTDKEWVS